MKNPCPQDEVLADYMENRLKEEEAADVEAHLFDCDLCMESFLVAGKILRSGDLAGLDPVPDRVTQAALDRVLETYPSRQESATDKIRRHLKEISQKALEYATSSPLGEPELVPIRSSRKVVSKDLIHLKKTFKNIDTEVEVEKTSPRKALIRVRLPNNNGRGKGVRVTLERDRREISSQLFGNGTVLFEDISFGLYRLTFSQNDVILGEYVLEIKESENG